MCFFDTIVCQLRIHVIYMYIIYIYKEITLSYVQLSTFSSLSLIIRYGQWVREVMNVEVDEKGQGGSIWISNSFFYFLLINYTFASFLYHCLQGVLMGCWMLVFNIIWIFMLNAHKRILLHSMKWLFSTEVLQSTAHEILRKKMWKGKKRRRNFLC